MSGEASKPIAKEVLWGGGRSPFSVSYGKMMMWFFLVSDALTFSGLLVAYGVSRHGVTADWPIGEQAFQSLPVLGDGYPLIYVALMTFILIVSSVTMVLSVEAGHRNDKKGVALWLGLTIVGGAFFVGSQAWEWSHFIHGSGGLFQLQNEVTVTAVIDEGGSNESTEQVTLIPGSYVYMTPDFGHEYEHSMGAAHAVEDHAGHDDGHGHAEEAHHASTADMVPETLILNKYIENRSIVSGADAHKLWESRSENSFIFGANLHANEYGPQQYADCFFFITGFHGFHVFSGVVINIIVFIMVLKGIFQRRKHYEMVEKIGLYWHFVDLVWVFVFTFFYLV
jgi:cytochrome c oxidase subunit 3